MAELAPMPVTRRRFADAWETLSGFGAPQGNRLRAESLLSYAELAELYEHNWLARKIVRLPNEDAFPDAITFDKTEDAELWHAANAYEGSDEGAFLTAANWGGLNGISLLVRGDDVAGELDQPLRANAPPARWLEPVSGAVVQVYPGSDWETKDERTKGTPTHYRVLGEHRLNGQRIHRSRVIVFYGPSGAGEVPGRAAVGERGVKRRNALATLSVLDPVSAILQEYDLTWAAASHLIKEASVPIWKLHGLIQGLHGNAAEVLGRIEIQQALMAVNRAVLLDAEHNEEYRRESARLADLPALLEQETFRICAAADIPIGRLVGRVVSGLGDNGAADDRKWNARVSSHRERTLKPRLERAMRAVGVKGGWKLPALGQPTEAERASTSQVRTQTAKAWWEIVNVPAEVMAELAAKELGVAPWTKPGQAPENETAKSALNGAQFEAALAALEKLGAGVISEGACYELLLTLGIGEAQAREMVKSPPKPPLQNSP